MIPNPPGTPDVGVNPDAEPGITLLWLCGYGLVAWVIYKYLVRGG